MNKKIKQDNNESNRLSVKVDPRLHAKFKVACYSRQMTIKESIVKFMSEFIHESKADIKQITR